MDITFHSMFPKKDEGCWQFDLLPALGVLRVKKYGPDGDLLETLPGYWSISLQWLFWSISIHITDKK